MLLTKSDFKSCVDCPTRLYYRMSGFPSTKDDDEFLQFLADGGFMVEFLAKARYPKHVDLVDVRAPQVAFERTRKILAEDDNIAIFEAAANTDKYHVRMDILHKEGKVLRLIEVKSSSVKMDGDDDQDHGDQENDAQGDFLTKRAPRKVRSNWLPYLQDLTFQVIVLEAAFPGYEVRPFLAVIDKGAIATEAATLDRFSLRSVQTGPAATRSRPELAYHGDVAELVDTKLMVTLDAKEAVESLRASVSVAAASLADLLKDDGVVRAEPVLADIYPKCRDCEFRIEAVETQSGFDLCWKAFAPTSSHILDLHRVGQIGSTKIPDPVPALLARGSASYLDLLPEQLGNPGTWATRRLLQWKGAGEERELQEPQLREILESHHEAPGFPLHFIDFEACNSSIPHHVGLHPYERVAFQWSCHTVAADGTVRHQGWLNDRKEFPNFEFARTLRDGIGDRGTIYVWSNYEKVTLCKVLEQLQAASQRNLGEADPDLEEWLKSVLGPPDAKGKYRDSPRIRDLEILAYDHYFHPIMRGKTSIKAVLPAVWESDARLHEHPCFRDYFKEEEGRILNPYDALAGLPLGGDSDAVREGTGAIRVYQDLIFSPDVGDRANRYKLLWQYCQLDTAAMLMIWMHWLGRYDLRPAALDGG